MADMERAGDAATSTATTNRQTGRANDPSPSVQPEAWPSMPDAYSGATETLHIENINNPGYPLIVERGRYGEVNLSIGESPHPVASIGLCAREAKMVAACLTGGPRHGA